MANKMYSRYLMDEHPISFHPSLAQAIGLNEAIMLQKINLWLNCKPKEAEGRSWIYNSYKSWQEQLPFWSESTIRRTLKTLVDQKIIITGNFNKYKFDKTIWYSIDYDKVDEIVEDVKMNNRCVQNEQTCCSNCTDASIQNEHTNTNDYTMITNNDITLHLLFNILNKENREISNFELDNIQLNIADIISIKNQLKRLDIYIGDDLARYIRESVSLLEYEIKYWILKELYLSEYKGKLNNITKDKFIEIFENCKKYKEIQDTEEFLKYAIKSYRNYFK